MKLEPLVVLVDEDLIDEIDTQTATWRQRSGPAVDQILEAHPGWTADMLYMGIVLRQAIRGDA